MVTYQMVKAPSTVATHRPTTPTRSETHPDFRRVLTIIGLIAITTALVAGYFLVRDRDAKPDAPRAAAAKASEPGENLPKVTVVLPKRGGMVRTTNQPGSIRAFEFAPLYAKVSGYVRTLKVDRGTRVQKGQLLMEIYDPELDAAVAQAVAGLEHARGGRRGRACFLVFGRISSGLGSSGFLIGNASTTANGSIRGNRSVAGWSRARART